MPHSTLGREYFALTDHSPNLTVAHGLTAERLTRATRASWPRSTDRLGPRACGCSRASRPTFSTTERSTRPPSCSSGSMWWWRASTASCGLRQGHHDKTDARGHHRPAHEHSRARHRPAHRRISRHPPALGVRRETRVFAACAENSMSRSRSTPGPSAPTRPTTSSASHSTAGCLFSIDSDAHAPGQLGLLDYGIERAATLGVPPDRIVTTWPVARLLAWSRARR